VSGFSALLPLARAGFLVKGVLYVVIGVLALQLALREGGRITGTRGALTLVLGQPFGRLLLLVAALGLLGYAAWRGVQAIADTDRHGSGWKGWWLRAGYLVRGALHLALGVQALRLYRGLGGRGAENAQNRITAELLQWPFGDVLVVLVGLGLIGFAIQQAWSAYAGKLEPGFDVSQLRRDAGDWAVAASRFGIGARAVVFALLGWSAVVGGFERDASEVDSTAGTLGTLASQPGALGQWMLGGVAVGFNAYGVYQLVHARDLQIQPGE
jgi:hypothetical protein